MNAETNAAMSLPYPMSFRHGAWMLRTLLTTGRPRRVVWFLGGIGDELLCTTVIHELRRRRTRKLWMMSKYPDLFQHNSDIEKVVPFYAGFLDLAMRCGATVYDLQYAHRHADEDREESPPRHILTMMCAAAGLQGKIELRPYFFLGPDEINRQPLPPRTIAIQSTGAAARNFMKNKEWYPERFQQVVDALKTDFTFMQVGSKTDLPLSGTIDRRGVSVRETASILKNAHCYVGLVGFLMHLTRAVDRRSVIIYGGREKPWQSGYACNENLATDPACSPCWQWNKCDFARMCMDEIRPDHVVAGIQKVIARNEMPLEIDEDNIK